MLKILRKLYLTWILIRYSIYELVESEGPSRRHPGVILFQILQESELSVQSVNANSGKVSATELNAAGAYGGEVEISPFNFDLSASVSTPGYESVNAVHVPQNNLFNPSSSTEETADESRNTPNRQRRAQISTPSSGNIARNTTKSIAAAGSSTTNFSILRTEKGMLAHREQIQTAAESTQVVATSRAGANVHVLVGAEQYRAPPWSPLNQLRSMAQPVRTRNDVAH